jgi:toxin CcdB
MARFDVYEAANSYVLDCQADAFSHLDTRLVVPLVPASEAPRAGRLNPVFSIAGERHVMATQLAAAIPARQLRQPLASLAHEHDAIIGAFDMLLTGY